MIGTWQAIVVLVVVVLLFGAKRIPDLAGSIGKGLKEFRKATKDEDKELDGGDEKKSDDQKKT